MQSNGSSGAPVGTVEDQTVSAAKKEVKHILEVAPSTVTTSCYVRVVKLSTKYSNLGDSWNGRPSMTLTLGGGEKG